MQPEHLRQLARKWAIPIVFLALVGAAAGYYVTGRLTPIYQVTGNVLVVAAPGQATGTGSVSVTANEATTTAATLMTEPALLQSVITKLRLKTTIAAVGKEVTATPETNSELVDVVVRDPSAVRAKDLANALMITYVNEVNSQNAQRINAAGAALLKRRSMRCRQRSLRSSSNWYPPMRLARIRPRLTRLSARTQRSSRS